MNDKRILVVVAAIVGLLTGLAFGGLVRDAGEPSPARTPDASATDPHPELATLRRELAGERRARVKLAAEVDQLRWAVEQLVPELALEVPAGTAAGGEDVPGHDPDGAEEADAGLNPSAAPQWFDASEFEARGYGADEIERLRARFDGAKMEELYLRDRAVREGWGGKPRLFAAVQKVRSSLRRELGDETYDLLLYATGDSNRVRLVNTLATSPAEAANMQPGDVIVRYDGRNVFSVNDVRVASRQGESGESVAVDVQRGDEEIRLYLPRGPLGARLQADRLPPD